MPFKSPCQPYRQFSSFKQKYISFEIFSPQLLLTKTKTKKQRLPASRVRACIFRVRPFILWLAFIRWSSGGRRSSLNGNASTLRFFFHLDPRSGASRWRAFWTLWILLFRDEWTSAGEQNPPVCSLLNHSFARATTILRKIVVRTPMTKQRRYSLPNCWTNAPKNHRACKVGLCQL